jgi:transposase
VARAVEQLLTDTAQRWIDYDVAALEQHTYHQEKRGRPGANTRWRRRGKTRFQLTWQLRQDQIAYDARCDGLFPLITNTALAPRDILECYKSKQPLVERQHHVLKAIQSGVPVLLKNESRIEAVFFLHFVALIVSALLERQVRRAMADRGVKRLPLYPEDRECRAPSAERILEVFAGLQRSLLRKDGQIVQRFDPDITALQRRVLALLGLPPEAFANC